MQYSVQKSESRLTTRFPIIMASKKNGMHMYIDEQYMQHGQCIYRYIWWTIHAIPHGLYPLAAQHSKHYHERMQKVLEVPQWNSIGKVQLRVVGAKQLHSNNGEYEDNDSKYKTQVTKSSHCSNPISHSRHRHKLPRAPIVLPTTSMSKFNVAHDLANLNTRSCK